MNLSFGKPTRYYESDGALRAALNSWRLLAFLSMIVAILAIVWAGITRIQPPTVIQITSDGVAHTISPTGNFRDAVSATQIAGIKKQELPDALAQETYVRRFLNTYLTYDPQTVGTNLASTVNMTTVNLRGIMLTAFTKENIYGLSQADNVRSSLTITDLTPPDIKNDPESLWFTVYGRREVHSLVNETESVHTFIEVYRVRVVTEMRTKTNPDGIRIADLTIKRVDASENSPTTVTPSIN